MSTRSIIIMITISGLLVATLSYNYNQLLLSQEEMLIQKKILNRCKSYEVRLKALNSSPQYATTEEMALTDLNQIIEGTVKRNGVSIGHIGRITQDRTKKIGDTEYDECLVNFNIQRATLKSLIQIMRTLSADSHYINIKEITLKECKGKKEEMWTMIARLSYYIYSPEMKS